MNLLVYGIGDISIRTYNRKQWEHATLQGVLHVLGVGRNLFSVWKAALLNIDTIHSKTGYRLVQGGETLIQGVMEETMYKLLIQTVIPLHSTYVANTFGTETQKGSTQSLDVWHHRLCHLNHAMVKKMAVEGNVDGIILNGKEHANFWIGCVMGKMHCSPFPWANTRVKAAAIGQLTHTDVCGPMSTGTVGGALYYVLFKNDHTSYRVVLCIKAKSKVLICLKKYVAQLEPETRKTMHTLHSNWGGEFTSKALR
jgi:hypothetical protein